METILIAGGTGLIGKELQHYWIEQGHAVRILSRKSTDKSRNAFHWDPLKGKMDTEALDGVTVIVNLSGAGIGDKRWSTSRKKELFDSRVGATECLWKYAQHCASLTHYITASGAVCYGFEDDARTYTESDAHGSDLLSVLTRDWEQAADLFAAKCPVTKIRISVVLSSEGGALAAMVQPVKLGFGSPLGSGTQMMPWIHVMDLVRIFDWSLVHKLEGVYHANAGNTDNATFMRTIAKVLGKKMWMPNAPAFAIRLLFGEMAVMVLKGVKTDNSKLRQTGFMFNYPELEDALRQLWKR